MYFVKNVFFWACNFLSILFFITIVFTIITLLSDTSSPVSALLHDRLVHCFWILYRFLACSLVFFVFVWLHDISSSLGVYGVICRCLVILCISYRFFVIFQFTLWLFLFNYTVSLLVLVFTASSLILVLLLGLSHISLSVYDRLLACAVVTSVLVWLHGISFSFRVSAWFVFSIIRRLFLSRYSRRRLWS